MQIDLIQDSKNLKIKINSQLDKMILAAEKNGGFKKLQFSVFNIDEIDVKQFKINNIVYVIKIIDFGSDLNSHSFCSRIKRIKDTNKSLKLPKVNLHNLSNNDSVLYVGKSSKNFANRMKQHFGKSSKKTYSLQIQSWLMYPELSNIKFELYYSSIDFETLKIEEHEEQKILLELLETAMHDKYKPMLGRTGH